MQTDLAGLDGGGLDAKLDFNRWIACKAKFEKHGIAKKYDLPLLSY